MDDNEDGTPATGVLGDVVVPYKKETVAEELPLRLIRLPLSVADVVVTFEALLVVTAGGA